MSISGCILQNFCSRYALKSPENTFRPNRDKQVKNNHRGTDGFLLNDFLVYNSYMPDEHFKIKTEVFEGPLDLLLTLIEKRKLFINDISLSKVADDFITYVQRIGSLPIAESAQFILIASTLLLIKSKSL